MDSSINALSRRSLLRGSVTLGLTALVSGLVPWQSVMAAAQSDADFAALSQFLVSRPVNAVLAARYYAALDKRAPNFSTHVIALKQLIAERGLKHVDDYLALADAVARTILQPAELPLGVLTALVGVPFFLGVVLRRQIK